MPLKVVRKVKPKDVLGLVASIARITVNVSDMMQFVPARAAATVLLVILQTVQEIETNKDGCFRLVSRAVKVLLDFRDRMEGKWEGAPESLIRNIQTYEETLMSISEYMKNLTKVKWMSRLLSKGAIEKDLEDYGQLLDEAERSFQVASLIEIHYAVGLLQDRLGKSNDSGLKAEPVEGDQTLPDALVAIPSSKGQDTVVASDNDSALVLYAPPPYFQASFEAVAEKDSDSNLATRKSEERDLVDVERRIVEAERADLDKAGFRRYGRADVRLKSNVRSTQQFWAEASIADVGGQKAILKRYEGSDSLQVSKKWLHDIKLLKVLYHPNLPQMMGFSDDATSVPFILLHHVKLRDFNSYMFDALKKRTLSECANIVLNAYRDFSSAVLYVQKQLNLPNAFAQDFVDVAGYNLDDEDNIIVGLPPPRDPNVFTARSYDLTESLVDHCMKGLPSRDRVQGVASRSFTVMSDLERKYVHLTSLLRAILPKRGATPRLEEAIDQIIDLEDPPTFTALRAACLDAGSHEFAWHEGVHACPIKFEAGDFGYIPRGTAKRCFDDFVKLGNVFEDAVHRESDNPLSLMKEAIGRESQWVGGFMRRQDIYPFMMPSDIEGWPVTLPPQGEIMTWVSHKYSVPSLSDAWRYLLKHAPDMASRSGVDPHEILLITGSTNARTYTLVDNRPKMIPGSMHIASAMQVRMHTAHGMPMRPGMPPIHTPHGNPLANHPLLNPVPELYYLFTSSSVGFEAFYNQNPSAVNLPATARGHMLPNAVSYRIGWPEAYMSYIQLMEDDFVEWDV